MEAAICQMEVLDPSGPTTTKRCRACEAARPLGDFFRLRTSPDGRTVRCKTCIKDGRRSVSVAKGHAVWDGAKRMCPGCGEFKPEQDYFRNRAKSHGRSTKCRMCHSDEMSRRDQALRVLALGALGGKCVGCGLEDRRVLCIDHVNGNGWLERQERGMRAMIARILNGVPGYQLLCHNCNHLKKLENGEHRGRKERVA